MILCTKLKTRGKTIDLPASKKGNIFCCWNSRRQKKTMCLTFGISKTNTLVTTFSSIWIASCVCVLNTWKYLPLFCSHWFLLLCSDFFCCYSWCCCCFLFDVRFEWKLHVIFSSCVQPDCLLYYPFITPSYQKNQNDFRTHTKQYETKHTNKGTSGILWQKIYKYLIFSQNEVVHLQCFIWIRRTKNIQIIHSNTTFTINGPHFHLPSLLCSYSNEIFPLPWFFDETHTKKENNNTQRSKYKKENNVLNP